MAFAQGILIDGLFASQKGILGFKESHGISYLSAKNALSIVL
jgi:hypothetical protein